MHIVIARPDYDCDGYSEGLHRVKVCPSDLYDEDGTLRNDTELIRALMEDDRAGFSDDPSGCYVMAEIEFLRTWWHRMSDWSRAYWLKEGYFSTFRAVDRRVAA